MKFAVTITERDAIGNRTTGKGHDGEGLFALDGIRKKIIEVHAESIEEAERNVRSDYMANPSENPFLQSVEFMAKPVFEPKYSMTVEQNIFVAKRNIVDYIYKSAQLEGLGVTYPDTETIFNGMAAPGVKVTDMIAVNNLKKAWQER
jgi:hypothetical protein